MFAVSDGSISEEDVRKLFSDVSSKVSSQIFGALLSNSVRSCMQCGAVRELLLKELDGRTYAQIEFMDKVKIAPCRMAKRSPQAGPILTLWCVCRRAFLRRARRTRSA